MKTRLPSSLMLMIIFCLSTSLRAQENREAEHACFRLENGKVIPLIMGLSQENSNLFHKEFIPVKEWSGKQVFAVIPAMDQAYFITINGFRFGSDPGSGRVSEYNITPFIQDQTNVLELETSPSAGEKNAASIIPANLLIRENIYCRDLLISTHQDGLEHKVLVRFHIFLKSYLQEKNPGRSLHLEVNPKGAETIFEKTLELSTPLSFGQETEMIIDMSLEEPLYWLPGAPEYYEVELSIGEKGEQKPELISTLFDIRSFQTNDSLFIHHGDSVPLVYPSGNMATTRPDFPDQGLSEFIKNLGINAIHLDTPPSCIQQEYFIRNGILPVFKSE
ncbi:MAG: hypothetical protein QNK35_12105 [Bacteroides sp.]|nr:hypothetical protein [Bacteroides sp.]